jgi:hypothetical protein
MGQRLPVTINKCIIVLRALESYSGVEVRSKGRTSPLTDELIGSF